MHGLGIDPCLFGMDPCSGRSTRDRQHVRCPIYSNQCNDNNDNSKLTILHISSTPTYEAFLSYTDTMASQDTNNIHISAHPCLRAKLSQLRSASTNAPDTKRLVHDISTIIACEALGDTLSTLKTGTDESPLGYRYTTESISPSNISIVPILRSGLSMVDAVQTLLPSPVAVHHLGMYRDKATLSAVEYYNNLPQHSTTDAAGQMDIAIIVDPIVATGSTLCAAIETLKDWGAPRIFCFVVLATEGGLKRAAEVWPEGVDIWVGGVDPVTDEKGMIKPGLGDIGDRLFMTVGK
ncbi:hypothetical protein LTR27_004117 [Elasticomyces elasticus]|nr:hypothetical protein LTR27_004117 [Elasticomyces elasticus]